MLAFRHEFLIDERLYYFVTVVTSKFVVCFGTWCGVVSYADDSFCVKDFYDEIAFGVHAPFVARSVFFRAVFAEFDFVHQKKEKRVVKKVNGL